MEKKLFPPSINFVNQNANVALESAGLKLVTDSEEWLLGCDGVCRASINNFGYGGTNARVIIESADSWLPSCEALPPSSNIRTKVLLLSARSEEACKNMVSNLKDYLQSKSRTASEETLLEDVVYTLG